MKAITVIKRKIPNPKDKIPMTKSQTPKKMQDGCWDLGFGIWDFSLGILSFAIGIFILIFCPIWAMAGEWNGLKVGISTAADAKKVLGTPISEYPDSLLFSGSRIRSKLSPDTIVVNINQKGVIENIFIFPLWGTTEVEIHKVFGKGQVMTYENFLKSTGRTQYGAGTRPEHKLHYMQMDNKCEFFQNLNILVIYDQRDLASEHDVVKLVVVF